jgi:hypothetical protein
LKSPKNIFLLNLVKLKNLGKSPDFKWSLWKSTLPDLLQM